MYEILHHCTLLDAAGCGLSARDLLECILCHRDHSSESPAAHTKGDAAAGTELSITSLDLSHNAFLTYIDAPWELLSISSELLPASSDVSEESPEQESEPMDLDACDMRTPAQAVSSVADAPAGRFLTWLLGHTPRLLHLDVSHCASTPAQAEHLCAALEHALQARILKGHKSLRSLAVRGVQSLSPEAVQGLQQRMQNRGVQTITSGFNFAI
jgi:hypothetical protein